VRCAFVFLILGFRALAECKLPEATDTPAPVAFVESLLAGGHFQRAKALIGVPEGARNLWLLSRAEAGLGHLEAALKLAEQSIALDTGKAEYHVQSAAANGRLAEHASMFKQLSYAKRAKKELDTALELDSENLDALHGLMLFYDLAPAFVGGDKQKALDAAEKLTRLNAARGYLAQARLANERKDAVAEEGFYKKAIAADPLLYEGKAALAQFYVEGGHADADAAEQQACDAVQLDPGRLDGWRLLAIAEVRKQCWDELFALLDRARMFVPDDGGYYYSAGEALLALGMHASWAEQFLRAYLAGPSEDGQFLSRGHIHLGEALQRLDRADEAKAEFARGAEK
jgi:tetratricopeptide (TPR) repeat protein